LVRFSWNPEKGSREAARLLAGQTSWLLVACNSRSFDQLLLSLYLVSLYPALFRAYAALETFRGNLGGPLSHFLSQEVVVALIGALPFLFAAATAIFRQQWIKIFQYDFYFSADHFSMCG